jgi:hypothetical protein
MLYVEARTVLLPAYFSISLHETIEDNVDTYFFVSESSL